MTGKFAEFSTAAPWLNTSTPRRIIAQLHHGSGRGTTIAPTKASAMMGLKFRFGMMPCCAATRIASTATIRVSGNQIGAEGREIEAARSIDRQNDKSGSVASAECRHAVLLRH